MSYERKLNNGPFEPVQLSEIKAVFARWYSEGKQATLLADLEDGRPVVVHHRKNDRQEFRVAK